MKQKFKKWLMTLSGLASVAAIPVSGCDLSGFTLNGVTSLGNNKYKIDVAFCAGGGRSNTRYGADQTTTNFAFYMSQNATVDTFAPTILVSPMTGDTLWGYRMVDDTKSSVAYDASVLYYLSWDWQSQWTCLATNCGGVQSVCGNVSIYTTGLPDTIWCRGMEAAGNINGGCQNLYVFPRCYNTTITASAGSNATVYPGGSPACAALSATASGGTGSFTYKWNTGATNSSVTVCPTATQIYTVKVSDAWGCNASSSVTVTASCAQNTIAAHAGSDQKVYQGYNPSCATLAGSASGGSGGYTYLWTTGAVTSSISVCPTVTTTYTLTTKDGYGCTASDAVTVKHVDVRCGGNLTKVNVCQNGRTKCINSSSVASYLNAGATLGACGSEPIQQNEIIDGSTVMELAVFPNPASSDFNISTVLGGYIDIDLYNLQGQLVKSLYQGINKPNNQLLLNVKTDDLSVGMYLIKASGMDVDGNSISQSIRIGIQ